MFNHNGRVVLQKLNLAIKYFSFSTSRYSFIHHAKPVSYLSTLKIEKFLLKNVILRESHTNTTILNSLTSENNFAHSILENSKLYSNCLASSLLFNQDLQNDEIDQLLQKQWISMSNTEILQNFELLSYYALENQEIINDSKYHGILEILKIRCPDFNDKEIHHLMNCLELWKTDRNELIYKGVWKALDDECLKRMPNWTINEIFLTNDQFYKLKLSRYAEFTWHSLRKIGMNPKKLTPTNLVQFTFLMKVNRRLPVRMYNIEYYLEKCADKLTLEELAIIAMAFSKYETSIKSVPFLLKFIEKLIDKIDIVNDITLNAVLQILRYANDSNLINQLTVLLKLLETQVSRLSVQCLVSIVLLETKILIDNEQLMLKILDRCEKEIQNIKLKEIGKILFGLYTLNYDPKATPFYSLVFNELLDPRRAEEIERFPDSLVEIVLNMLKVKLYSKEMLNCIMEPEYISKISKGNIHNLDRKYLDLDFCIELEHPEYNGPRVQKDLLNFLIKRFGPLNKKAVQINLKQSQRLKLMNDIAHICKLFTGSDSAVHIDSLLPHIAKSNIVVCYDPKTKEFVPPSEKLAMIPPETVKYAPDDDKNWYALVIDTYHLKMRSDTHSPTSTLTSEIRQLECIGYTPILISYHDWQNLSNETEKQKYITNILCR